MSDTSVQKPDDLIKVIFSYLNNNKCLLKIM